MLNAYIYAYAYKYLDSQMHSEGLTQNWLFHWKWAKYNLWHMFTLYLPKSNNFPFFLKIIH